MKLISKPSSAVQLRALAGVNRVINSSVRQAVTDGISSATMVLPMFWIGQ